MIILIIAFIFSGALSNADKNYVLVQQICPVSGHKLDVDTAIKVKVGKQEIFLCQESCVKGKIQPTYWSIIHRNFAKAQGICTVMEHKIPQKAKYTIANGRIFYVCCPPCIEDIKKDPVTHIKKLDKLYAKFLKERENSDIFREPHED